MKPRRDITLGEMQDECKKRDGVCCGMDSWESCEFFKVCPFRMQSRKALGWDLSDPPRFNEAQMALLVTMKNIGARHATQRSDAIRFYNIAPLECIAVISKQILNVGETLDLAELFGKDGKE